MKPKIRCRVTNIVKSFSKVHVLDHVSFDIHVGEIHAIIGENGAGKSTLMNILSGVFPPDSGSIEIDGTSKIFAAPCDARDTGIAMIHQELSLFKSMSVYENMFIGRMPKKQSGMIDRDTMIRESRRQLQKLGVKHLDPRTLVKSLSVSQMQLVEIAKAISLNAKMLIMDEPTSSLTAGEIKQILAVMELLKQQQVSIVFITHKLEEIMAIADRITVLRDGKMIRTLDREKTKIPELVSLMVGRNFEKTVHRQCVDCSKRDVVLEAKNISIPGRVFNVSFSLHRGEILGLTGLVGAGRSELLQGIFGMYSNCTGVIKINGQKVSIRHPEQAIQHGLGLVPEGRKEQGMFLKLDVENNMTVVNRRQSTNKAGVINKRELRAKARQYIQNLSIKTTGLSQISRFLSGGNQQKTIIARWLMNHPQIMFLDEPTHGIDIGAKSEIYSIIDHLAQEGISIILLSSELPEVLGLCDRIMVMHHGRLVMTLSHEEADEVSIMNYAFNQQAD